MDEGMQVHMDEGMQAYMDEGMQGMQACAGMQAKHQKYIIKREREYTTFLWCLKQLLYEF